MSSQRTVAFTICSNNYLSQADVLFASLRDHHPEIDLVLGLADLPQPDHPAPEGVRMVAARDLDIPDFDSFAFRYDVMEFNTALKPSLFLHLLASGYTRVVYFDPDIAIYRRLDDLMTLLADGASFVLTPHVLSPPGPGAVRSAHHLLQTGAYNLGFVAASASLETERTLRWWARMLRYDCVNAQERGLFVDQKFMDLLPGLAEQTLVLRDPGFNVAYWNIQARPVTQRGSAYFAADRPLAFFHFSGFDPRRPDCLARYAPDLPVEGSLAALLSDYATRRLAARPDARDLPYGYGRFASGIPIPDMVRRCFRERHATWSGDPFAIYDRHVALPSATAARGLFGDIVTVLMEHYHASHPELRLAFDLGNPFEVTAYWRFFARVAEREAIDPSLWCAR